MSERDDERGDYPAGAPHPRGNGLLPEDSVNSALPADLAAVQADDALLDALRGPNPFPEGSDARLTQVLMAWRGEVDSEPVTQLMDTDTALAVVARARRPAPRRGSGLVPFAAAAAVLVIAFSGLGVGARAAEPGDPLFALTQVLDSEGAALKQAKFEAREQLQQVDTALAGGRTEDAETALREVDQKLAAMPPDADGRAELEAQRNALRQRLESQSDTDGRTGATSSSKAKQAPDARNTVESSTGPEASTEDPSESLTTPVAPDSTPPANPGQGTGGSEGEGAGTGNYPGTSPRYAPPPQITPPVVPAPPQWSPER